MSFTMCRAETELLEREIAHVVRSSVPEMASVSDRLESVRIADPVCLLEALHPGRHAAWLATLRGEDNAAAWLRWDEERGMGAIDWLANCLTGACHLYRGHAGGCDTRNPFVQEPTQ